MWDNFLCSFCCWLYCWFHRFFLCLFCFLWDLFLSFSLSFKPDGERSKMAHLRERSSLMVVDRLEMFILYLRWMILFLAKCNGQARDVLSIVNTQHGWSVAVNTVEVSRILGWIVSAVFCDGDSKLFLVFVVGFVTGKNEVWVRQWGSILQFLSPLVRHILQKFPNIIRIVVSICGFVPAYCSVTIFPGF